MTVSSKSVFIRVVGFVSLVAFAVGCSAAAQKQPAQSASADPSIPPPPQVDEPPLPKGHVWRSQVMAVLSPGPGRFLQKIEVEPQLKNRRFYGFRIVAFHDRRFWRGVDLKVGDVIRRVNGQSIGYYDDAYRVWTSLATAPQLVVEYERAGKPRTLTYTIHDPEPQSGDGSSQHASAK